MIAGSETTPAETLDYARVIVEATDRMTRIIKQLLEFARRKGTDKTTCALEPLARRTLDMLSPLAAKRDVRLVLSAAGETLAFADASALEQVMTNLVVNAVQSMTRPGTVTVEVGKERSTPPAFVGGPSVVLATVRVTDEGEGIREDDVARVFEPFFTTKDVGEGTGLGLSVAYGIVQEHGGWIAVESAVGKGSAFTVYLPILESR
jgi:signal transduction histidine kinase